MVTGGVPAGASRASQSPMAKPGKPCAAMLGARAVPVSPSLQAGYAAAQRAWAAGQIDVQPQYLAMNMLLDRSAPNWAAEFARLKGETGACDTAAPITPNGALAGRFVWACEKGKLNGQVLLAPTPTVQIQALRLTVAK